MSAPETEPKPGQVSLERDDVDDVIGHAEGLRKEEEGKLSLDDMRAVGRELDIDEKYIDKAVARRENEKRDASEAEARAQVEKKARLRTAKRGAAGAVALLVLSMAITWLGARSRASDLRALDVEVQAARSQLVNVRERQSKIEAEYRPRSPGPDRDAELLGAENRVRVERKRYDEAAARYNAEVGRTFGGTAVRLYDVPARQPLSDEVKP